MPGRKNWSVNPRGMPRGSVFTFNAEQIGLVDSFSYREEVMENTLNVKATR